MSNPHVYAGAAHNEILQVAAELGAAGLVLLGGFLWVCFRRSEWSGALLACIVAGFLCLVEFPAQNPATGILIATALGLVARKAPKEYRLPGLSAPLVAASLVVGSVGLTSYGARHALAESHFGQMKLLMYADREPVSALHHNLEAIRLYPLPARYREQLASTLTYLMGKEGHRVVLSPEAAERIFSIARSAGPTVAVLLARAQHLLAGEMNDETRSEMENVLRALKENARLWPGTWAIEATFAARMGDVDRIRAAVKVADDLQLSGRLKEHFDTIRELM